MENGYEDEITDLKRCQEIQMEFVNMHLGTNLQYKPATAVMDCI